MAFAPLGVACVRGPGLVRVVRLGLGWVGVLLPAAGFLSAVSLFFSRCGCAVLSWWLVSGIDERGPGSGMRDAWGAGRSPTRRVCGR